MPAPPAPTGSAGCSARGEDRRYPGRPARLAGLLLATGVAVLLAVPALASADTPSTLTVVGTSDVSDSGLSPDLIQPAFEKAFPGITYKYIGKGTGAAISSAEGGADGASVLVVHAASLENQFVAGGYSYEKYGRAVFTNDFVLAGPSSDPAGVGADGAHNIAQAFADVAAAGIAGRVTFVSRGGTPGTTVEEHELWQLVRSSGLAPSGLLLCTVGSAQGGGETPIAPGHGVTAPGQPCPGGLPTSTALPKWYLVTGLQQGPNVIAANACTTATGVNTCYVLTDRGTYDFTTLPANGGVTLKIVSRDNSAGAPGGADALINYFHAYIINPGKPGEAVNLTAAQNLLNLLTSPSFQAQLKNYLPNADPGGPPFRASASPIITLTSPRSGALPRTYRGGRALTIAGVVTNAQPGYPRPAGQRISVDRVVAGLDVPIATTRIGANGHFRVSFVPPVTGSYVVATPQIAQIENSTLNPPFGDILSPASTTPVRITVHSAVTGLFARSLGARALIYGTVAPSTGHVRARVTVYARAGGRGRFRAVAGDRLSAADANFAVTAALAPGSWQIKVAYADPGQVVGSTSRTISLVVGGRASAGVSLGPVSVGRGRVSAVAGLTPPASAGARVQLLGLRTDAGAAVWHHLALVSARGGTRLTLRARLPRGSRWALAAVYTAPGRGSAYSGLRTVTVS